MEVDAASAATIADRVEEWSTETRPWIRLFARAIDTVIAIILAHVLLNAAVASGVGLQSVRLVLPGLVLWILVEPMFLAWLGTTPGKALLATRIRTASGENPLYHTGLERSFRVSVQGLGLGIPVLYLVTMLLAYLRLADGQKSAWDQALALRVEHRRLGLVRIAMTTLVLLGLLAAGRVALCC